MSEQALESDFITSVTNIDEYFINVRGNKICVRSCGPEEGQLILFVHGIQSHAGVWEKISKLLAEKGYRVVAMDRRGHGLSDHTQTYYLFDYVSDLNAVVRQLTDKPFTLVGHCESSLITALYAGAFPERMENLLYIQFPIAPRKPMDDMTRSELLVTFLKNLTIDNQHNVVADVQAAAERSKQGAPFPMPDDVALHVAKRNIKPQEKGYIWRWDPMILNYRLLYNTIDMSIIGTSLAKVKSPVTFIYGNESTLMETDKDRHFEVTASLNPQAKHVLVPGGHYPHMETNANILMNVIMDSFAG